MKVRLYTFNTQHLRHWVDQNTLKKLEVARTPEKSAHPWHNQRYRHTILGIVAEVDYGIGESRLTDVFTQNTRKDCEISCGCGSLLDTVTNSWPTCYEFEPSTAEDPPCREAMPIESVEA
ncbi:hypothetical protein TNCV_2940341 [Trichonephila clavipes]|nr:hypothetical protein TNCV_2940341 [Trichonephila clavipes]